MKRLLAVAAALVATVFIAAPAQADTTTFTMNIHGTTVTDAIPFTCAGPFTGFTVVNFTGNTILHGTINNNGSWFTGTVEGVGTVTQTPPGSTFQGHAQEWFGDENNKQNGVEHATFNFTGNNVVTGARQEMHANFDITMNADGTITASHFNVSCSG